MSTSSNQENQEIKNLHISLNRDSEVRDDYINADYQEPRETNNVLRTSSRRNASPEIFFYQALIESQNNLAEKTRELYELQNERDRLEIQHRYQTLDMANLRVQVEELEGSLQKLEGVKTKFHREVWTHRLFEMLLMVFVLYWTVVGAFG